MRDLRRKIVEVSERHGGRRVSRVSLEVGALSHVTEASLRQRWETTFAGTPAASARLTVETASDLADPGAQGVRITEIATEE